MTRLFSAFLLIILALAGPTPGATGFAGEFLSAGVDARAMALGSAFTAVADNATAGYWNSAGLSRLKARQAHFAHSERFEGLVKEDYIALACGGPWLDGMAIGILRVGVDDIQLTELQDPGAPISPDNRPVVTSTSSSADYALYLSGGHRMGERLDLGLSLKLIYRTIDSFSAHGLGMDIGLRYRLWPGVTVGANLRDVTSTPIIWDDATDRILPSAVFGLAMTRQVAGGRTTLSFGSTTGGDAEDASGSEPLNAGLEYEYGKVSLRAGMQESRQTFGIGVCPRDQLSIDLAYLQHDELEATYLLSAAVGF